MDDSIRTEVLDIAPIELAKKQELTMQDVRKFLDNYLKELIPNRENKRNPNTGELLLVPKSKYYTYRNDEREIYSRALEERLNNDELYKVDIPDDKTSKLSDILVELKKIGWTVRADCVPAFAEQVFNILDYIQNGTVHQENLYLKSSVEGNGKSTLKNKLLEAFKASGARVDNTCWPTGEYSDVTAFAKNHVVGIDDTSWDSIKNINEDQIKAILRRQNETALKCNIKRMPIINLKARAAVIACGNTKPPKADDRCWKVIETNSITVQEAKNNLRLRKVLEQALDSELQVLYRVPRLSKILRQFFNQVVRNNSKNISITPDLVLETEKVPMVIDLLLLLQKYRNAAIDFHNCCLNDFLVLEELSRDEKYRQSVFYSKTIKYLYSKGYCARLTYGDDIYAKFDLSKLLDIDIEQLATQRECRIEAADEVLETMKAWDELIEAAKKFEQEEEMNFQQLLTETKAKMTDLFTETGEILSDNHEFLEENTQKIPDNTNKAQQFILLNEPLEDMPEPDHPRKDINRKGNNFIFEVDDLPIDKQKEMIVDFAEEHKENILWLCSSGNKSIHCAVHTNCNTNESSIRKEVQQYFNKKYFQGHLDMSTYNAGRICRNPNGYRIKDGVAKLQQAYLINENAKPLDVSDIVAKIKAKQEEEAKKLAEERAKRRAAIATRTFEKKPLTVETLQARRETPRRNSAIAMLEGNATWGEEMVGACMYLLGTGYTREDILDALWGDEWIEDAINKAEENLGI